MCGVNVGVGVLQLHMVGQKIHPIDKSLHRVSIRTLLEASATGHHLWTIQTIVENVYVWLVGPRRRVPER